MIDIGRVCIKIAGRDAGKVCVVVDHVDGYVLIDGQTRRRKCNPAHLEPTDKTVDVSQGADHNAVKVELEKISIKVTETKPKPKKERAKKQRKGKVTVAESAPS